MSAPPNPAEPAQNPRVARAQRYLQIIDRMVELGAETLEQLRPDPNPEAPPNPAAILPRADAFDRATRAIRRCMLLAERFEQIIAEPDHRLARRTTARIRVTRGVEDNIARSKLSLPEKEALAAELYDRLDRPDAVPDLENRDIDEFITEITRDLGLHTGLSGIGWPRRTLEELDQLQARAAAIQPLAETGPIQADPLDDDDETADAEAFEDETADEPLVRPGSLMEWALNRPDDG